MHPACPSRTTAFEAKYPPALLPLPGLPTNFAPVRGRAQTKHQGCGWVRRTRGKVQAGRKPHAPKRRPSLLSKFNLAPAICSYLTIASFTASLSERRDTKTVISSAYAETFARATLPDRPLDHERLRALTIHLHSSAVIQHVNPSAKLWFESDGLQNCHQKPMVHHVEGLGLI